MPRFDWGKGMETGGKYAYDILSEQERYKKKMQEIEAKIKGEREEKEKERQTSRIEDGMDFIESMITSGKFNPETNQALYQAGLEMGLPLPMLPGMGMATAPTEIPTTGTTMTGGMARGLPPLRPEDVAGMGSLFEAPAEEPKPPTAVGDKRLFAPIPPELKTPTPIAPEKMREQAYRLTTSVMRGPQFQELLSGLDSKARIKFEEDFAQMLERTYKFLQAGQFPEMTRTEKEWDELLGE